MQKTTILRTGLLAVLMTCAVSSASLEAVVYSSNKDSFVQGGDQSNVNNGSSELLLVKYHDRAGEEKFIRKTYINFDITGFNKANLDTASLQMFFVPSNLGAPVPAGSVWSFDVYGISSSWNEGTITYNNAPGNNGGAEPGNSLSGPAVSNLGSFMVVEEGLGVSFSSAGLNSYIQGLASNNASFAIVRTTNQSQDNYVHAITSREFGPSAGLPLGSVSPTLILTEVPEPSTYGMLGAFLAAAGLASRRRKAAV